MLQTNVASSQPRPAPAAETRVYDGPVKVAILWVTPAMAARWLGKNNRNRKLTDNIAKRIARDILNDDFALNGETIKLADDGTLIDGQHRLEGIVHANQAVWCVVVGGLPMSAQETVDRVKIRNIPDALRFRGEKDVNVLASAISNAIVLQSDTPTDFSKQWPSIPQAIEYLDAHRDIERSVKIGEALNHMTRSSASSAAAIHHWFSLIDSDDADDFFAKLTTGADLPTDSPIYRLRDFMFKELAVQRRTDRHRLHAYYIKCWNFYRKGQPMLQLRWTPGGKNPEAFPRPI